MESEKQTKRRQEASRIMSLFYEAGYAGENKPSYPWYAGSDIQEYLDREYGLGLFNVADSKAFKGNVK